MKLASSIAMLETLIKLRIQEFEKLGREAKWILESGFGDEDDANMIHMAMARIVIELKPVEEVVLKLYPRYKEFFATLTEFYHEEIHKLVSLAGNL